MKFKLSSYEKITVERKNHIKDVIEIINLLNRYDVNNASIACYDLLEGLKMEQLNDDSWNDKEWYN